MIGTSTTPLDSALNSNFLSKDRNRRLLRICTKTAHLTPILLSEMPMYGFNLLFICLTTVVCYTAGLLSSEGAGDCFLSLAITILYYYYY